VDDLLGEVVVVPADDLAAGGLGSGQFGRPCGQRGVEGGEVRECRGQCS
jgi:hypothetical protein